MKKIMSILLVMLVLVSIVGCSSNQNPKAPQEKKTTNEENEKTPEPEKEPEKNTEKESSETSGEIKKVVIWAWDQNFNALNFAIEKYKEKNPDIKIEAVVENVSDTVKKLSTFMASGVGEQLPDMVLMDNNEIQSLLIRFPDKIVNLSKNGFDKHKDSFSKAHWEVLSKEGSIYAFPFDIAPLMMQVNTEILEKAAGINPEQLNTWQDVIDATPKVIEAGYAMNYQFGNREVLAMMQSAGVGIFDSEGHVDLLNPVVVKCVDTFQKLIESKSVNISFGETEAGDGKVALAIKPAWLIGEDIPAYAGLAGKVKLYPIPSVMVGDMYTRSANDGGSSWFILENSKVQDIAYGIGEILATDLDVQKVALKDGLMPGFLDAVQLPEVQEANEYFQGQPIWQLLSESAKNTRPIYVNEDYSAAKEIFSNIVINEIENGTDKTAKELLAEAAEMLSMQTGREINKY